MTLVILAAGMGSRYGGLKQIDPITAEGEFIIDFSVYDAIPILKLKYIFRFFNTLFTYYCRFLPTN